MKILITGVGGFIGFSIAKDILENKNYFVYGIDNLSNISNQSKIKKDRIKKLKKYKKFTFKRIDINNFENLNRLFKQYKFKYVVHLAALAGVRLSHKIPKSFFDSNVIGFYNLLEISKNFKVDHFIYASSSSVYGNSKKFPQTEKINTDQPESFYAATKKTNEVLAQSYSTSFGLRATGLRFFTVYGPFGREDMSLFNFAKSINNNKEIKLYNYGKHYRDFTHIEDVINALNKIIFKKVKLKSIHNIYNIGYGKSHSLSKYINLISKEFNITPKEKKLNLQSGDVYKTLSDIKKISKVYNYKPKINLIKGIKNYVEWYKEYYIKNRK